MLVLLVAMVLAINTGEMGEPNVNSSNGQDSHWNSAAGQQGNKRTSRATATTPRAVSFGIMVIAIMCRFRSASSGAVVVVVVAAACAGGGGAAAAAVEPALCGANSSSSSRVQSAQQDRRLAQANARSLAP